MNTNKFNSPSYLSYKKDSSSNDNDNTNEQKHTLATVNKIIKKNWNIECAFFWFKVQARAHSFGFQAK